MINFRTAVLSALTFFATIHTVSANRLDSLREAFTRVSMISYAPPGEATNRFIRYSDYGRANDVLLLQLYMSVRLPDPEVERLLGLFDAGCFWADIDYSDRTRGRWQPTLHLTRMYALAKLYADRSSRWYGDARIGALLHSGLGFWYSRKPSSLNWWHGEIGVPKKLAAILLMIRGELSDGELEQGLAIIERSQFGKTGQNKAWLAGNNLMRGLLTDDEDLVARARDQLAEEIVVTCGEGIQEDWSFHQHGPQIQFGNYGLAYVEGMSFWFRVLDGTPYMFTDKHYRIIANLMKEGIGRSVWKGLMDPSFCGRQVFIDAGRGKACAMAVAAENLAALKRPDCEVFERIAGRVLSTDTYTEGLCGPQYYPRSDCGIYRTPEWYSSIRMHSERTVGFEFTNGENSLANFSADGALLFMQHGREYENIFAHWDWRLVPGTTAYDDGAPLKRNDATESKKNRSAHVGGTDAAGVMCATMELERDGLHALKSVFFFDDLVVALGTGIRSSDPAMFRITTSVDQTHLAGPVILPRGSEQGKYLPWVHHDGRGYVSLNGARITVGTGVQSGTWDLIDPFCEDEKREGRVFKCWFEHDPAATSSYAYAFLPHRDVKQTKKFARKPPVKILRNDTACQAVEYGEIICIVAHIPGKYIFDGLTVTAQAPLLYIFRPDMSKVELLPVL